MITISRNDPCWCGSGLKYKKCHFDFDNKLIEFKRKGAKIPDRSIIKTAAQINGIRESGKVNVAVLDAVASKICAGMSTEDIDRIVYQETIALGGIPAPLNYEGFPKSVCTSVNDVVCHGIPCKEEVLQDGDIINVDCSTLYNGYFSDSSRMFMIGNVSEPAKKLVEVTHEAVMNGLKQVRPWGRLGDMSAAVYDTVRKNGYSVVREIGGHGIGLEFHEDPFVGYTGRKGTDMLLVPGFCFTIEPMVNAGGREIYVDDDNGWTVYTDDESLSAQWEIQVMVTEDGYELMAW